MGTYPGHYFCMLKLDVAFKPGQSIDLEILPPSGGEPALTIIYQLR